MQDFDKFLIRSAAIGVLLASIVVGGWFGWQLAVQAVISNLRAGQEIQQLSQKLQACEAKGPSVTQPVVR